jgi:hypothetical protein
MLSKNISHFCPFNSYCIFAERVGCGTESPCAVGFRARGTPCPLVSVLPHPGYGPALRSSACRSSTQVCNEKVPVLTHPGHGPALRSSSCRSSTRYVITICQSYLTLGLVLPCALALAGVPHRYVTKRCQSYLTLGMVLPCALALAGVPHRYVITRCQSYLTLDMVLPCALARAGVPHRYVITRC